MMAVSKSRRIDRIDGRTVLFLTLCACLVTFLTTSFLGHGIFTLWICLILCWFGLFRQAIGCFSIYMVALVWLLIEMKYKISVPSPLLLSMVYKLLLIVLDEPTSGLDGTNMRNVSRMIRKLAKMGRTIIVITHDAECALACCERAIRLENGCITDDFQIRGAELLLDKIGYDKKEG